jgi:hypothetical protein
LFSHLEEEELSGYYARTILLLNYGMQCLLLVLHAVPASAWFGVLCFDCCSYYSVPSLLWAAT